MGYPKAKPRGLTIAGLTVSVACIATKSATSQFAGLDISVKETSICIVDDAGKIVREVKVASEPQALLAVLKNLAYHFGLHPVPKTPS
jgi:hypothetical protein